jgi:hypothetical protein
MSCPTVSYVRPRLEFSNVKCPLADDGDQLDLPVDVAGGQCDLAGRASDRGDEFGEHRGRGRRRQAGLHGVFVVVQTDREQLPWLRGRCAEFGVIEVAARRQCSGCSPLAELVEALVDVLDLRAEPTIRCLRDIDSESSTTMLSRPARLAMCTLVSLDGSGGGGVRLEL